MKKRLRLQDCVYQQIKLVSSWCTVSTMSSQCASVSSSRWSFLALYEIVLYIGVFHLTRVRSGLSELLIMCLISLELPLSLPARTVFYKETYSPLEMPLHDMTSKEMAIPMRPASKKKKKKILCCLLPWRPNCYTGALSSTDNPSEKPTVFKVIFTWLEYVDVCVGTVWEQWAMIWWHFSVFTVWQCKKDFYQNITNNELWILQDSWCCLLNILYFMSAVIYYNSHASLVLHHEWVYSHPANLLYLLQNIKYNSSQ